MKKTLLGSLRESCRPQKRASLTEVVHKPLKEMFGDDGETIQIYGALLSEIASLRESVLKRRESVANKIGNDENQTEVKTQFTFLFDQFFNKVQDGLNELESSLKQMETGGVPVSELNQPTPTTEVA